MDQSSVTAQKYWSEPLLKDRASRGVSHHQLESAIDPTEHGEHRDRCAAAVNGRHSDLGGRFVITMQVNEVHAGHPLVVAERAFETPKRSSASGAIEAGLRYGLEPNHQRSGIAATPGSVFPSISSSEAPPPVETCVILAPKRSSSTACTDSPPPTTVAAPLPASSS